MVLCFFLLCPALAQVGEKKDKVSKTTLLKGQFLSRNKSVKTDALIENYIIAGNQRVKIEPPIKGLHLVEAKAGKFVAVVNNKKQEHKTGDFWVIKPGNELFIETDDDAAILQVYTIGGNFLKGNEKIASDVTFRPAEGQYKLLKENAFARESYSIGDPSRPLVKILDINVGPGKKTEPITFTGYAMIQVLSGSGVLIPEGREIKATLGTTLTLDPDKPIVVNNPQDRP